VSSVIQCPDCGRPNGTRFPKCMYCGGELPELEDGDESRESGDESLVEALDPAMVASLPPGLRSQFRPMSARKETAPKFKKHSHTELRATGEYSTDITTSITGEYAARTQDVPAADPPAAAAPTPRGDVRVGVDESLVSIEAELEPIVGEVSYDQTLDGMQVESLVAELEHEDDEDPFSLPDAVSLTEPADLEPLPVSSMLEEYEPTAAASAPLLKGRGPWGPRDAAARVLLLPDPGYRDNLPWLRARLHAVLGLDAYTCNLYLQRVFPVFLEARDSVTDGEALLEELGDSLRLLLLAREVVAQSPRAVEVGQAEIDDVQVVFAEAEHPEREHVVSRYGLEAAYLGEIKPEEAGGTPLVERGFWRNKPRARRGFDDILNPYWLLDLVFGDRTIRIRSDRFDFSCLGTDRAPSTLLNLRNLAAYLALSDVELDELFKRVPTVRRERNPEADEEQSVAPEVTLFDEYVMVSTLARRVRNDR
jgi:hypothetical protein